MRPRQRVVILGAGISGLAAAYEVFRRGREREDAPEALVLEASSRVGGKILSVARDGAVYEAGPDSFLSAKPDILDLAKDLGISKDLLQTKPDSGAVSIYRRGRLRPLRGQLWPPKASAILGSGLLSWAGLFRLAMARFSARQAPETAADESLASFARRRFGPEVLDALVGPLLAGIYASDPEQLSLESAFPQIKAAFSSPGAMPGASWRPPVGKSLFMTFRGGLSRLTDALALALPSRAVRTGVGVQALVREGKKWRVETSAGVFLADAVISALPANVLAPAVEKLDPELAAALREIPFSSTATVSLLYDDRALPARLRGFGFLVAAKENRAVVGATYSSAKFPGRAPEKKTLVRCFLGGAGQDAVAAKPEEELIGLAAEDLSGILGLGKPCVPEAARVWRWIDANPQYTVGHGLRLKRIESCLMSHPGLFLAGASYRGVGLPDCARSGQAAARLAVSPGAGGPAVA